MSPANQNRQCPPPVNRNSTFQKEHFQSAHLQDEPFRHEEFSKKRSLPKKFTRQTLFFLLLFAYTLWVFSNHIFLVSESNFSTIIARTLLLGALYCLFVFLTELTKFFLEKLACKTPQIFLRALFTGSVCRLFCFRVGFWRAIGTQRMFRSFFVIFFFMGIFLQIRDCLLDYYRISGNSMAPSLPNGQIVFLAKWKNGFSYRGFGLLWEKERRRPILLDSPKIQRKALLVFELPARGNRRVLLKRAIGLPGDHYRFSDGRIWINGKPLKEPYLSRNSYTSAEPPLSLVVADKLPEDYHELSDFARYAARFGVGQSGRVPEHTLLVLGDNRQHSIDSRNFGFVPYNRIVGVLW